MVLCNPEFDLELIQVTAGDPLEYHCIGDGISNKNLGEGSEFIEVLPSAGLVWS